MVNNLSVVIQTHNEAQSIAECIESVILLTDSIVVVDTESTDNTVAIAREYDVDVHTFPFSRYVEPARQFGIERATQEWVFILDADERIDNALIDEIQDVIQKKEHSYFKVPRKNIFGKKFWLQHGGWWPDHQMRLFYKPDFKEWPARIHSTPIIDGSMGYLNSPIIHYFHGDIEKMVNKTIIFEDVEAKLLFEAGRPVSTGIFFRKYAGELYRRLLKKKGYKDGPVGIIESVYQAFSKTITWLYLYEKKKSRPV